MFDSFRSTQPPSIASESSVAGASVTSEKSSNKKSGLVSVLISVGIIIGGIVIVAIFQDEINAYGMALMQKYGRRQVDIILFLLTAVSASPLCLPIWQYVLVGTAMGYSVIRLSVVMALGSAVGSQITYYVGRYFGETKFVKRRFPNAGEHLWVQGRSRLYVSVLLFLGTASPLPFDVLYFACGIKRYPPHLLYVLTATARFIRYLYLGYGFTFFSSWL